MTIPDDLLSGTSTPVTTAPERASGARAARGGLLLQITLQLGSLVTTLVLARLLSKSEFGIVALASSLIAFANLLSALGLGQALIRSKDNVDRRASTYFWVTCCLSVGLATLTAVLSYPLATLLGQPGAWIYVVALTPVLVLNGATAVPQSLLKRKHKFGRVYTSVGLGALVYFVAQIALALQGYGAWSVIVGQVAGDVVTLCLALSLGHWRPRLLFDRRLLREDLRFLTGLSFSQILVYAIRNCDYWMVSRSLGAASLGAYYVAYVLPNILRQRVSWAVQAVLYVHMAQADKDAGRREALWRQVWRLQAGLGIPALCGISILADPLVTVLFGAKWHEAVAPLRILSLVALIDLHMVVVSTTATALGMVGLSVRVLTARLIGCAGGVALALAIRPSVSSAAVGVAIGAVTALIAQERLVSRRLGVGLSLVRGDIAGFGAAAAAMTGVSLFVLFGFRPENLVALLVIPPIGAATYFGAGWIVHRQSFRELMREVHRFVRA